MIKNIIPLTRAQVEQRAMMHLKLVWKADGQIWPVEYRLDESGLLGGDDPRYPHGAELSYGARRYTMDCIGHALYCVGIARRQPGYKGSRGEWLNTDSVLDDAHGDQVFFRTIKPEEMQLGDLVVTRSTYFLGKRIKPGHIEVGLRPRTGSSKAMSIGCSPRFGRKTAIGVGYEWSSSCEFVRALNVIP